MPLMNLAAVAGPQIAVRGAQGWTETSLSPVDSLERHRVVRHRVGIMAEKAAESIQRHLDLRPEQAGVVGVVIANLKSTRLEREHVFEVFRIIAGRTLRAPRFKAWAGCRPD